MSSELSGFRVIVFENFFPFHICSGMISVGPGDFCGCRKFRINAFLRTNFLYSKVCRNNRCRINRYFEFRFQGCAFNRARDSEFTAFADAVLFFGQLLPFNRYCFRNVIIKMRSDGFRIDRLITGINGLVFNCVKRFDLRFVYLDRHIDGFFLTFRIEEITLCGKGACFCVRRSRNTVPGDRLIRYVSVGPGYFCGFGKHRCCFDSCADGFKFLNIVDLCRLYNNLQFGFDGSSFNLAF